MGAGGSHPLVVLSILHRHYQAMLRLDGAGVTSGEQAAALLGLRSAFPAKKALEQGRRLGPARLGRAVTLWPLPSRLSGAAAVFPTAPCSRYWSVGSAAGRRARGGWTGRGGSRTTSQAPGVVMTTMRPGVLLLGAGRLLGAGGLGAGGLGADGLL